MSDGLRLGQRVTILECPTNGQHNGYIGQVITEASTTSRVGVALDSGWWCWPLRVEVAEPTTDDAMLSALSGERNGAQ